ncbi:tRNA (adenosine(37)-N6)-threonylcarbamoyltransferase complex ATPase subunit type 1 TsaE [Rothia sp. AR01]|uniref:tRNA threonylcarbamoyladenosine biosynthesis protein TsaE n=1 Tax=Rothia santali TaxID=2949643 RepID=A0A9X2HBY0_9MICC|nr:tRNA (adenosine(37)-N6)-threonylcarbamoyltransferase complex ATPase subunit type 1 TsaE [Rothia santali]MCP3424887.1 tRNA (adenosine(37)-N6)-threonylcarbamoyltransferase complex ATPase subunit type 1 TsaE [Rothia santali]
MTAEARGTAVLELHGTEATQRVAHVLAGSLRAGDLLILTGELGAGKTTFTRALGAGLGISGSVISPTFVLSRVHRNDPEGARPGGPSLVHVDAYRLGSAEEVDDLDLEYSMDGAVTVVEWGRGLVEHLAESRVEVELERAVGTGAPTVEGSEEDSDPRILRMSFHGPRWREELTGPLTLKLLEAARH